MAKPTKHNILDDIIDLPISPKFDIYSVKGTTKTYKDIDIKLAVKLYDKKWHYSWLITYKGEQYGTVFLSPDRHKELKNLAFITACMSIDKLTEEK